MYQALYRKWRPQSFDDVIGQQHITESLKKQVTTERLSHAYIFIGTRGTGKTTCARILAKAVNCENPVNGNPCCRCPSCVAIGNGEVMDIVELDAASNNSVDNVRALREEAVFSPTQVKKRVYIIDEVHMLSGSAFNALLKILEEPPEHLIFILATTELQKVPATILSRCQRHSFRRINQNILSAYLLQIAEKECIRLTKNGAELIAGLAEGGVRDALSMLDQCSAYDTIDTEQIYSSVGLAGNKRTMQLFELICSHDTDGALSLFHTIWMDGRDPVSLLRELSSLVRDILLMRVAPISAGGLIYGGFERATIKAYAEQFKPEQLSGMLEKIQYSLGSMRDMLSPKITAELCIITLCNNIAGDTLKGLNARVSELELAAVLGVNTPLPAGRRPVLSAERIENTELREDSVITEPLQPFIQPSKADEGIPVHHNSEYAPSDEASSAEVQKEHSSGAEQPFLSESEGVPFPNGKGKDETGSEDIPGQGSMSEMTDLWARICEQVKDTLSADCRSFLPNIQTVLTGDTLVLNTGTSIVLERFNKLGNLDKIAASASLLTGRRITVKGQVKQDSGVGNRDINELKRFKEVTFL